MSEQRHSFTKDTARRLCDRVAGICSNPACRATTSGPHSDGMKAVSVGIACHIHGASPGGPRYDPDQTEGERRSIHNGIWLCGVCGPLVDKDEAKYPAPLLREWRSREELAAYERLGKPAALSKAPRDGHPFSDEAADVMKKLAELFVQGGFPNIKVWSFGPVSEAQRVVFNELRALGLLSCGSATRWYLTERGVAWVMRNRRL